MNEVDFKELCVVLLFNRFFDGTNEEKAIDRALDVAWKLNKRIFDKRVSSK